MFVLDLFSGIGGFSLGLMAANYDDYDFSLYPHEQKSKSDDYFKTVAFCEIDAHAQKVLAKNFKGIPIFSDVTALDKRALNQKGIDSIDIITGGFPCQDLSVAGKRAGFEGERSILFKEILRIADETKAKYILFENSEQLITNKRLFSVFAQELRAYGYGYRAFLFRASDFGYPHQRKRAFVIAYSTSQRRAIWDKADFSKFTIKNQFKGQKCALFNGVCERVSNLQKKGSITPCDIRDIRGDNGVSEAVERVKQYGNSLIPAIPCYLGKIIKNIESELNK